MAVTGYTGRQIGLHWVIAILIGLQYFTYGSMRHSWFLLRDGKPVPFDPLTNAHVAVGITVLLLALPRLWLRLTRGAPRAPENEPPILSRIARINHIALYAIILGLPLTGMLSWFGQAGAAALAHITLVLLLLVFVALHVLGAIYQTIVLRSGVLWRMFRASGNT